MKNTKRGTVVCFLYTGKFGKGTSMFASMLTHAVVVRFRSAQPHKRICAIRESWHACCSGYFNSRDNQYMTIEELVDAAIKKVTSAKYTMELFNYELEY